MMHRVLPTTAAMARAFSTGVQAAALAKPQLQLFGIEGRYAHALYSAAVKKGSLETVEKELREIRDRAKTDAAFSSFLQNPIANRKDKSAGVRSMLSKVSPMTSNFFGLLAENNRLANTTDIISAFEQLMASHRHEVPCQVTSAEKLDEKTLKTLTDALQGFVKSGEVLKVKAVVDPRIRGGLVLDIGDRHVDMSIATRVKKLAQLLRQPL